MVCGHADCTWLIIDDRLSLCATEKTDKGDKCITKSEKCIIFLFKYFITVSLFLDKREKFQLKKCRLLMICALSPYLPLDNFLKILPCKYLITFWKILLWYRYT